MNNEGFIQKLFSLVEPIVIECGYELYYLEYVKEAGENYLRVYIDSSKGIGLDDCEKISRAVSDMLDAEDPISDSYYLEVSSPGIERVLYTDAHLQRYIGENVVVKLSKLHNSKKLFEGILTDFTSNEVIISVDESTVEIPREKIKVISLKGEF